MRVKTDFYDTKSAAPRKAEEQETAGGRPRRTVSEKVFPNARGENYGGETETGRRRRRIEKYRRGCN